jgi:intracellular sulfur oxidation DsrE/DsrF family protein
MRQLLLIVLLIGTCLQNSFAQPKADEPAAHVQKFYFPSSLYDDSLAFTNAIPSLAEKVIAGFSEKEKKNFEKSAGYYFLAQDYQKVLAFVDSLEKKGDALTGLELKQYALAKIKEKDKPGSFDQTFKQGYTAAFNQLSFRKKVSVALFDSSVLKEIQKGYTELKEKFKKDKVDSLSYEDAGSLLDNLSGGLLFKKIYPLISPLITDPKYVQQFPAIKGYKWAGVVPVQNVDDKLDPNMQYKLLMELTGFAAKGQEANAMKDINGGIGEVARKINLHVADGVRKEKMDVVIIVHAGALFALLNNEKYKQKYQIDNPNIALIKELQNFGAKFIVCGQAMTFLRLEKEDLLPGIKEAISAQTVLSMYELKGYKFYDVKLE